MNKNIKLIFAGASLVALGIMWTLPSPQFYWAGTASICLALIPHFIK